MGLQFWRGKAEGKADMRELLGGKGANLAEMSNLGLPVPPGFTITTEVCTHYTQNDSTYPKGLEGEVAKALAKVEKIIGSSFGDAENVLLVSVRSGARVHAGHDGHSPEPGPERRDRRRPGSG